MTEQHDDPGLEFGPGGYLPERASKRARKIVLRAPLGMQWIAGAVVAGVLVVVAGLLFLSTAGGPPGAPYEAAAAVGDVSHGEVLGTGLVSLDAGRARVFHLEPEDAVAWCATSRHFESSDGRVWSGTGRGFATASLSEHPSIIVDDVLYVDWSSTVPGPRPATEQVAPAC